MFAIVGSLLMMVGCGGSGERRAIVADADLEKQVEDAKIQIAKPFPDEEKLEAMCKRLDELNAELDLDKRENEIVDGAEELETEQESKSKVDFDREER